MSSNAYCEPCAPATWIVRPATSTLNCGVAAVTARPIPKQFLHELDDLGALLEEDFAEELDSREELLVDTLVELELDCGVTLEEDFAELLDGGVTLELDCGALEELELYLPK